ncbi:MAG: type II toxin-antitoxin system prevent-host-death family antitoxin [Mogibacterium sp.]|jgi:prevent-host-death family protein|nr:type II toxin-antitoxin system prevent-host-death family antitoxin [Mogibacterium sp.]
MIQIRPVSDLRNKFTEIESTVREGQPVYLTKNGYGSMVVLSLEMYSKLTDPIEMALDKADYAAEHDSRRMTHDEIFGGIREKLNAK